MRSSWRSDWPVKLRKKISDRHSHITQFQPNGYLLALAVEAMFASNVLPMIEVSIRLLGSTIDGLTQGEVR